jgi:hypothetical protein
VKQVLVEVDIGFHGAWVVHRRVVDWSYWNGDVYRAMIQQAIDEYTRIYGWRGPHGAKWMLQHRENCVRHSATGPYGPIRLPTEPKPISLIDYEATP